MSRTKTRYQILNLITSEFETSSELWDYKAQKTLPGKVLEFKTHDLATNYIITECFNSIYYWSVKNPVYGNFLYGLSRLLPAELELPKIKTIRTVEKFIKDSVEKDETLLNQIFELAYSIFNENEYLKRDKANYPNSWLSNRHSNKFTCTYVVKKVEIPVVITKKVTNNKGKKK